MIGPDLLDAIGQAPVLPGARCRGKAHLFDPRGDNEAAEVVDQRHAQAVGLCQRCPSLSACATWFDGLPKSKRPTGVVAGKVGSQKAGRPRKTA